MGTKIIFSRNKNERDKFKRFCRLAGSQGFALSAYSYSDTLELIVGARFTQTTSSPGASSIPTASSSLVIDIYFKKMLQLQDLTSVPGGSPERPFEQFFTFQKENKYVDGPYIKTSIGDGIYFGFYNNRSLEYCLVKFD